jgi:hypothetical protein
MIMEINLDCPSTTAKVFAAVGKFLAKDSGPSCLLQVEAGNVGGDHIGVITGWDVHPTPDRVTQFREAWDQTTGLHGVTIVHDAPSSIVDRPDLAALN